MESLPKTLIEVLNSAMKENQTLSWRIHGMDDKVIMNLMWTTRNRYLKGNGQESMLSSRSARNMENSLSSIDDGYLTMKSANSENSLPNLTNPVSSAKNLKTSSASLRHNKDIHDHVRISQHDLSSVRTCSLRLFQLNNYKSPED
jgi:hypothetical protein